MRDFVVTLEGTERRHIVKAMYASTAMRRAFDDPAWLADLKEQAFGCGVWATLNTAVMTLKNGQVVSATIVLEDGRKW